MKDFLFEFYFYKTLINTNDEVKKINQFSKKNNNIALFSVQQTMGRGRINRKWISRKGDLTCSFLINREFKLKEIGQINLWFSHILISLLKKKFPKQKFKIKWPNDIYLEDRKLAGILIETIILKNNIQNLIIGLGLNFVSSPKNLENKTISISYFAKKQNPINFFILLTNEINDSLNKFKKFAFKIDKHYLQNFKDFGKTIKIKSKGKIFKGIFFGIGNNGEMILKINDKTNIISFGDII